MQQNSDSIQMNHALIECRSVCKDYDMGGEVIHALRDVSLTISRGEYVAIMGPSGFGDELRGSSFFWGLCGSVGLLFTNALR